MRELIVYRMLVRSKPKLGLPFISVILPTVGRPSVRSAVLSLLNSDYSNFELLLIHDLRRRGSTVARNVGLSLAEGEVVHFAEDDCIYEQSNLRALMRKYGDVLARDSQCAGVVGSFNPPVWGKLAVRIKIQADHQGLKVVPILGEGITDYLAPGNSLCSKQAILRCGGFNERYYHMLEDVELSLVLKQNGMTLYNCADGVAEHLNAPRLEPQSPLKRSSYLRIRNSILLHKTWCGNPIDYVLRQALSDFRGPILNHACNAYGNLDRERRREADRLSYFLGAVAGLASGTARKTI